MASRIPPSSDTIRYPDVHFDVSKSDEQLFVPVSGFNDITHGAILNLTFTPEELSSSGRSTIMTKVVAEPADERWTPGEHETLMLLVKRYIAEADPATQLVLFLASMQPDGDGPLNLSYLVPKDREKQPWMLVVLTCPYLPPVAAMIDTTGKPVDRMSTHSILCVAPSFHPTEYPKASDAPSIRPFTAEEGLSLRVGASGFFVPYEVAEVWSRGASLPKRK